MSTEKQSHLNHVDLSINWDRAIYVDEPINEQLVRRLTPAILKFRQESNDPITVAISSPGGSLASLETILGLLQGPTQFSSSGQIVTVVTNKAYSAAANLLALGNYSVALTHSKVLFHDVRFSEMEDVTPSKAINAAKSLQGENDRFALILANQVIRRLVWVYIDFQVKFLDTENRFEHKHKEYANFIPKLPSANCGDKEVDIVNFATCLFSKLSIKNQSLIDAVVTRLGKWLLLTKISDSYPTYRQKGSRKPGLLDGMSQFHKEMTNNSTLHNEESLKLISTLLIAGLSNSGNNFEQTIEEATRNFHLIQSMNDEKHLHAAVRIMLRHEVIFFDIKYDDLSEDAKKALIKAAMPHAQRFWLFCVSLCSELFEGEHILSPIECQLLGLVDEVAGGGAVESRREFRVSQSQASSIGIQNVGIPDNL